jgi:hypothetical protein
LRDGRQRRLRVDPRFQSVEPDDREVAGHGAAELGELRHATDRVAIGREDEGCHRHPGRHKLLGDVGTSEFTVVEGGEEPLRIGLDVVGEQRPLVGLMTGAHVGLDQVGRASDALRAELPGVFPKFVFDFVGPEELELDSPKPGELCWPVPPPCRPP